jgi:hypothetical protein
LDRSATRQVGSFQEWSAQYGIQVENGFCLVDSVIDGIDDWKAATYTSVPPGSRVLFVPNELILSSARIAQDYQGYVEPSLEILAQKGLLEKLHQQFYLFLKVLVEYEQGVESPYFAWLDAMPRRWNTAVSMDEFCLSCLPPFIKTLCQIERKQYQAFREALQAFEYITPQTKSNEEALKFAYNVVFTRSWALGEAEHQIVPMADMVSRELLFVLFFVSLTLQDMPKQYNTTT